MTTKYKKIVKANQMSGASPTFCPFFEQLDEVLGTKASTVPPCLIDSGIKTSGAKTTKTDGHDYTEYMNYLNIVEQDINKVMQKCKPNIVIYNAGIDILKCDPLSAESIIKREYMVIHQAVSREIPIVIVISGGYKEIAAEIISDLILFLRDKTDCLETALKTKITTTSKRDEKSDDGENFELIENVTSFGHQ